MALRYCDTILPCYYVLMLLQYYVAALLCPYIIAIPCCYVIMSLCYCNIARLNRVKNKVFQAYRYYVTNTMTSDVIRRHYMSYNPLFHNCLHGHNFAKSEPMNGLEHLPTDSSTPLTSRSNPLEVDSLFKRTEQVVFLYDRKYSAIQKPTCPP